jgi:ATP-dependent RNA helicase DHX8/PRP22
MEDLESLELLSLVSKITSELENHLGISDKTLAEFVLDQHTKCSSLEEFKTTLSEMGAEFPQTLIESIDRLVLTMHPKYKKKAAKEEDDSDHETVDTDVRSRVFKGLAIPDKDPEWTDDLNGNASGLTGAVDDLDETFAALESLAGKTAKTSSTRKRSNSTYDDEEDYRNGKRNRRSRSPERYESKRRNDDFLFEDDRGRQIAYSRNKDDDRRHGVDHRRNNDFRKSPSPELDETPILYKIYTGRVTGIKDFGVFVTLPIKGDRRVDGLVHVSAMQEGARVNHPGDLVSRGQEVKVKVMKTENNRISLSMKEVDQRTGEDLAPHRRIASGANMEALGGAQSMDPAGLGNPRVPIIEGRMNGSRNKKRMTSPERWELKQLAAAGLAPKLDDSDEEEEEKHEEEIEEDEDVDIELKEEEPPFLAGQTKQSLELSPIRIVRVAEGSLNRAAMSGEVLARERRELRQQEAQDKAAREASQVDLSAQWNDPMAGPGQRKFATDLRNAQSSSAPEAMPEWKRIAQGKEQSLGKRTSLSIKEQRESLPVFKFRDQLIEAVHKHQLLIVVGDTGSGKTTQLTQYLAESGFANDGIIGCTQPRRVAAMSVAKRVSEEVGTRLGHEVGYTIRFEDMTGPDTKIKYMTDGILQREILLDPMLTRYSVIMLDEAHERTIATDVLFGLLKKTLKRRPDLKVIVTSATLDADKFSEYFNKCPIFSIPGRTFPVEVLFSKTPVEDYVEEALTTVLQIHLTEPAGDILVFLTGKEEIDTSCEVLYERMKALGPSVPPLSILPIYSALPTETASLIFEPAPPGGRKVVIATNIAETSITIDGIYYVIDPGFVKQSGWDPKLGMDRLQVTPISQAQAKQRAGRAGRTGPGKCFRLYTEAAYQNEMLPTTIPEIQRQNLSNTILMLKAMGINDLLHFDFMDPPPTNTMLQALEELYALGSLDDEGLLTRLGRQMADYPMDPTLSKSLIKSVEYDCIDEMLTIVAMISGAQTVFHRPKEKQQQADQKKSKFHDPHGDHLTLLNVYNGWIRSGKSTPWCYENFIQPRSMKRVEDVRKQLVQIVERHRHRIVSCGRNTKKVRQALCAGFFRNSARKDPQEGYKTLVEGTPVYMHPASALFGKPAEHVIYHSLVETTKEYMHNVTAIEPKWLVEVAPTFFKVAPTDRLSKRKKEERIQPLHNRFAGEDDWRLSTQRRQGRGGGGTWG